MSNAAMGDLRTLRAALDAARAEVARLTADLGQTQDDLRQACVERSEAREEITRLTAQLTEVTRERDALQRHYDAAGPEHNLLELFDLYDQCRRDAEADGARLRDERDTLRAKLDEVTRERDSAHDFIRNIEAALEGHLPDGYTADNATAVGAIFRTITALETLRAELKRSQLKSNQLHEFCPDHRDKQRGKPCLACENERLRADLRECGEALEDIFLQTPVFDAKGSCSERVHDIAAKALALPAVREVMEAPCTPSLPSESPSSAS